jgi:hypothetical protein
MGCDIKYLNYERLTAERKGFVEWSPIEFQNDLPMRMLLLPTFLKMIDITTAAIVIYNVVLLRVGIKFSPSKN